MENWGGGVDIGHKTKDGEATQKGAANRYNRNRKWVRFTTFSHVYGAR